MITDIFARRYEAVPLRPQYMEADRRFMNQAVALVGNTLWAGYSAEKVLEATETGLKITHDALALELGRETLSEQWWFHSYTHNGNTIRTPHKHTYAAMVKAFLIAIPEDLGRGDAWVKDRLSLVELAYRYREGYVGLANSTLSDELIRADLSDKAVRSGGMRVPGLAADGARARNKLMNDGFAAAVGDLNGRMKLAGYKLHYHNGFIQLADDALLSNEVAKPFWSLVADPRFANVDLQIKEAIDRRDRADRTAAFHAVCALESCIKIISDLRGWTTGHEKGASHYIDNLNSKANGRFIEVWEAEMLKTMFSDVRNPFAHGPGQEPMPVHTTEQTNWAIDTAMTWCKSLLRRL